MREAGAQRPLRYRLASGLLAGRRLLSGLRAEIPPASFRILLFHHISEEQIPAFDRLLQHLMVTHEFVTPAQAETMLEGGNPCVNGRARLLLTFDDGFASQARAAREILSRYAIKAVFFLCPGLMDLPEERQREGVARFLFEGSSTGAAEPEARLVSWPEAEALAASGHTIGSHTAFHRRLSGLGREELPREIEESGEILERRLRVPIRWFAYPFGNIESIDDAAYEWIRRRYRFSCSGIRGINSDRTSPLALLRDCIDLSAPLEYQDFLLLGGLDWFYRKQARWLVALAEGHARSGQPRIFT